VFCCYCFVPGCYATHTLDVLRSDCWHLPTTSAHRHSLRLHPPPQRCSSAQETSATGQQRVESTNTASERSECRISYVHLILARTSTLWFVGNQIVQLHFPPSADGARGVPAPWLHAGVSVHH